MRRLALAAAAVLAACSVKLEGAPCTSDANCPGGQACGYDRTCSEAAAACVVNQCRVGDASCPSQSTATTCVAQGVCGTWQTTPCTAQEICGAGGCQPRYTLQITNPGAGFLLGASGVSVDVTLTPGPGVSSPSQVTLVATSSGTSITSTLPRTTAPGVSPAQYSGTYVPLPNLEEQVTLQAYAAYQMTDQTGSSPVPVIVDTLPPRITGVTLTCGTCRRDDVLTLHASVADGHLGTVAATVDFPSGWSQPVSLTPPSSGNDWQGTLPLAGQAFPFYQASGAASVTAADSLGNQGTATSSNVTVTRLRFAVPVETVTPPAITGPAVNTTSNLLYVGAANGKVYVVDPVAGSATGWLVASAAIVAPPSLGAALWVGSQDGTIYAVNPSSGVATGSCATSGQVVATPAIDTASPETAYAGAVLASSNGRIFAVRTGSGCVASTNIYTTQRVVASPAIDSAKHVYVVTGSNMRSLALVESPPPPSFSENWTVPVGPVEVPVGLDPGRTPGFAWTADTNGNVAATSFGSGAPLGGSPFSTAAGPSAPVIDSAGSIVVGDAAGFVHKVVPGGAGWTTSSSLGGAAGSALVLAGGDAAYLVPTSIGKLAALRGDGSILWMGQVASVGASLGDPNVLQLPGDAFWTAVFGAQDGTVYGVLVDGHLDTTAPWPKARHDSRNTGNIVTPLP